MTEPCLAADAPVAGGGPRPTRHPANDKDPHPRTAVRVLPSVGRQRWTGATTTSTRWNSLMSE